MKKYRIAKGWRICIHIILSIGILLGLAATTLLLVLERKNELGYDYFFWFFTFLILVFMVIIVFKIRATNKTRLVINSNKICSMASFFKKELFLNEIKGYHITRVRKHCFTRTLLFIESNTIYKKSLSIDITFFGKANKNEIKKWLSNHYSELGYITN